MAGVVEEADVAGLARIDQVRLDGAEISIRGGLLIVEEADVLLGETEPADQQSFHLLRVVHRAIQVYPLGPCRGPLERDPGSRGRNGGGCGLVFVDTDDQRPPRLCAGGNDQNQEQAATNEEQICR